MEELDQEETEISLQGTKVKTSGGSSPRQRCWKERGVLRLRGGGDASTCPSADHAREVHWGGSALLLVLITSCFSSSTMILPSRSCAGQKRA